MNESIQAGAPDINYKQGDVMMGGGEDQQGKQVAASIWEQMEPEQKQQFGSFDAFFAKRYLETNYSTDATRSRSELNPCTRQKHDSKC